MPFFDRRFRRMFFSTKIVYKSPSVFGTGYKSTKINGVPIYDAILPFGFNKLPFIEARSKTTRDVTLDPIIKERHYFITQTPVAWSYAEKGGTRYIQLFGDPVAYIVRAKQMMYDKGKTLKEFTAKYTPKDFAVQQAIKPYILAIKAEADKKWAATKTLSKPLLKDKDLEPDAINAIPQTDIIDEPITVEPVTITKPVSIEASEIKKAGIISGIPNWLLGLSILGIFLYKSPDKKRR